MIQKLTSKAKLKGTYFSWPSNPNPLSVLPYGHPQKEYVGVPHKKIMKQKVFVRVSFYGKCF